VTGLDERRKGNLSVRPLDANSQAAWDEFVFRHPDATLFHGLAWKRTIERTFGYEPRYLLAEEEGEIRGVLPLFAVGNWLAKRSLISTPFGVYGGICADHEATHVALLEHACQMAKRERVEYLELREKNEFSSPILQIKQLYVTFDQELPTDPEELFKGFPRDTRYMIRKGQKNELKAIVDNDQLDLFYDIYAYSVRNLGTPTFSKDFFLNMREEYGPKMEITVIWQSKQAVSAVLSFLFRDWILPYYGGSLPEGRRTGANNFMYWEVMRSACERGIRHYDFGRSKLGTGAHFFKTQWNMRERPLPYQYFLVQRKTLPNYSPTNPKFKLAISLWGRMPLPLTKTIGPMLIRLFP